MGTPEARSVSITDQSRFVVGYHGCDASVARSVLLGEQTLGLSANDYDWLGAGAYFWEQGPARARQFAVDEAKRNAQKIRDPSVVGAYIFLGNCFDLLDLRHPEFLSKVYLDFKAAWIEQGLVLPKNERRRRDGTELFHRLDRAVIEYAISVLAGNYGRKIDTVRGAFQEGPAAFPGSEIRQQTHVQIAVRNIDCILGYFKPKEI